MKERPFETGSKRHAFHRVFSQCLRLTASVTCRRPVQLLHSSERATKYLITSPFLSLDTRIISPGIVLGYIPAQTIVIPLYAF